MSGRTTTLAVIVLAGCRAREPTLIWEGGGAARAQSVDAAVAGLPAAATGVRRGPWGESPDATFQLLDSDRAEEPHVHVAHDLTVAVLRGRGTVMVAGHRYDIRAGDVLHVGRGRVHAFAPSSPGTIALAIFTPKLDGPDYVPASAVSDATAGAR